MTQSIFLSASVPLHGREFYDTAHPYQIHTAVRSLLLLAIGRRQIVFGGHPSITPMVYSACQHFGLSDIRCATIYQSQYFKDEFPLENAEFADVRLVPALETIPESIALMRQRIFTESEFAAGIFIGGMKGILDEYAMFRTAFPDAKVIVVRAGGGAAATLPQSSEDSAIQELERSRDFFSLYATVLGIDPSSDRDFTA